MPLKLKITELQSFLLPPLQRNGNKLQMEDSPCSNNTAVRKQSSPLNCFNAAQVICLDSVLKLNLHFQLKHVTTTFLPCSPLTLKRASRASINKSALVKIPKSLEKRQNIQPLFHTLTVSDNFYFPLQVCTSHSTKNFVRHLRKPGIPIILETYVYLDQTNCLGRS